MSKYWPRTHLGRQIVVWTLLILYIALFAAWAKAVFLITMGLFLIFGVGLFIYAATEPPKRGRR